MRREIWLLATGLTMVSMGCQPAAPPPRVPVPAANNPDARRGEDYIKPLPEQQTGGMIAVGGFNDVPLVNQRVPEQRAFVDAYNRVGRPRILVFVNRTLEGSVIPVDPPPPALERDQNLRAGQYDEAVARALDYQAIETILMDWIASNGQVTVVSPTMARQRLSDEQVKELQAGRPQMLGEIAQKLDADVLVQVQARPTRQTAQGMEIRVIAEALNVQGGQSLGRVMVDVPPPLDKIQMNEYTRFVARKLMDDMIQTWMTPAPQRAPASPETAPAPAK